MVAVPTFNLSYCLDSCTSISMPRHNLSLTLDEEDANTWFLNSEVSTTSCRQPTRSYLRHAKHEINEYGIQLLC